jgi:pimeloyl-ACP methyl ester carboxylesterase
MLFNYAEGPDAGPALLLLHAQTLDWYTYSEVLPALAAKFHVFAVDYPGHGKTICPDTYPMTASQIGGDLAGFI